jgi:hypothetical protein
MASAAANYLGRIAPSGSHRLFLNMLEHSVSSVASLQQPHWSGRGELRRGWARGPARPGHSTLTSVRYVTLRYVTLRSVRYRYMMDAAGTLAVPRPGRPSGLAASNFSLSQYPASGSAALLA